MIEKLDKKMEFVEISILGNKKAECLDFEAGRKLNSKINELIDAVNELHTEAESNARTRANHEHKIEEFQAKDEEIAEWIAIVGDLRKQVRELQAQVSILEEHAHPTAKTPVDPYAEQRKWIGCLCRFWFDNKKQADIGILGDINEDDIHPYFNADLGHDYKCCEPVKPDDDIIYKGE